MAILLKSSREHFQPNGVCMVVRLAVKMLLVTAGFCVSILAYAAWPEPDVPLVPNGTHVVVNLPQARMFVYQNGQLVRTFPVAVGKMLTQTPMGNFEVKAIYKDPSWNVPRSIQEEMKKQGKPVQTVVPPGPENPLGKAFVRFGDPKLGLGFHGTNAPGSVPGFRSHGCIRLKNEDIQSLAQMVSPGASVTLLYQTVLLSQDEMGQLWLTAYKNPYKQPDPSWHHLAEFLVSWQKEHSAVISGHRVDLALKARSGKPVCLTCGKPDEAKVTGELVPIRWLGNPANMTDVGVSTAPAPVAVN